MSANDDDWLGTAGEYSFYAMILVPFSIIGYQILIYLKHGYWLSLSATDLFHWLGAEWARNPTNWIGAHRILDAVPLSIFSFVFFLLIVVAIIVSVSASPPKH